MDYSETSFQIPTDFGDESSRLNDMQFDFDALDDSVGLDGDPFTTPLPKAKKHALLTVEDLVPKVDQVPSQPQSEASSSRTTGERLGSRDQTHGQPPPPIKAPVDDLFERRKRDNYLQMGVDLSAKSTARYRHNNPTQDEMQSFPEIPRDEPMETTADNISETPMNDDIVTSEESVPVPTETKAKVTLKSKRSSILGTWGGIAKQKSPPAPTLSISRPKPILKRAKKAAPPPSLPVEKTSPVDSERPKRGEINQGTCEKKKRRESASSFVAFGGGLVDVLMSYGEKLRDSFGFSSSTKSSRLETVNLPSSIEEPRPDSLDGDVTTTNPPTVSSLATAHSPAEDILTVSQLSPSKVTHEEQNGSEENQVLPMRSSTKRAATSTLPRERKKGKTDENAVPQRPSSTLHIKGNEPKSQSKTGSISKNSISRPRPLGISRSINRAGNVGTISKSSRPGSSLSSNGSKNMKLSDSNNSQEAPVFAPDVYRQLTVENSQKKNKESIQNKTHKRDINPQFPKPVPPARPKVRPTVPMGFTFQSDARMLQRHSEFEEKKKSWEKHTSRERLPVPDFALIHSVQNEGARKKRAQPVVPEAPVLTTMIRAKEREKFDEERKEREKELQRLRELREQETAQQEEKQYREARKKTVIRAHEVPEWYREMPKKKALE